MNDQNSYTTGHGRLTHIAVAPIRQLTNASASFRKDYRLRCPISIKLTFFACALLFSNRSDASDIIEYPIVLNGGTLQIKSVSIKLDGINALELDQKCIKSGNIEWECGLQAKRTLGEKIGSEPISCRGLHVDAHGYPSAACIASSGEDLSAAMVRSGYALAGGRRYQQEESAARLEGNGMWSGTFQTPWEWRAQQPDFQEIEPCDEIDCFHLSRFGACR
jgi:endonuclease YncB( thermonuclease family)